MVVQSKAAEMGAATARTKRNEVLHSDWYRALAKYEKPDIRKATWQLIDTLVPYFVLWALMIYMIAHGVSCWLLLPLILAAGTLSVRIFIFFHDCCHNCFFESREANRFWGYVCGILTFTPYANWRYQHARHHATAGDLSRRGIGDVWTMTVDDFLAAPRRTQIAYRLFRHPFVLFVVGPPMVFLIS